MNEVKRIWLALFVLALMSPLGIVIPEYFGAGGAWGEESPREIQKIVGFLPAKMTELAEIWQAPLPDYTLPDTTEASPLTRKSWDYFVSAILGLFLCGGLGLIAMRLLNPKASSATFQIQSSNLDFK